MTAEGIFEELLKARGYDKKTRETFLNPAYEAMRHDPFLLPDMEAAVARIAAARDNNESVWIYGDYDIDGLTATSVLLDALPKFGLNVQAFIPNRFIEGYGLSSDAITTLAGKGAQLIITVDCGSLSHKEIDHAGSLGVDVIVTDHHNVAPEMPAAVAVINPKRLLQDHPEMYDGYLLKPSSDSHRPIVSLYPFLDLAGVGVAFKLVQALQQRLEGLPAGHEKWLLDLVAFGTVCDVVSLEDENRANVYWGLKVMQKTRRPGLRALAAVASVELSELHARHLGYVLGPHLNASGRLETAMRSLDVLTAPDGAQALSAAQVLREMNLARRADQDVIFAAAKEQAERYADDPVLVLSHSSWSHGIIGIVAAKILETYKKPTYVLQEMGIESKGSARSYGDFSAADAIRASERLITKGGGHKLAAGVTLPTANIAAFRASVNDFYRSLALRDQLQHLDPQADVSLSSFDGVTEALLDMLASLEPCGKGNPQAVFHFQSVHVANRREMGADKTHLKLTLADEGQGFFEVIAFGKAQEITARPGDRVEAWCQLELNEWNGRRSVQGKLLKLDMV